MTTAAITALVLTSLAVTVGIMVVEFVKGWRATKRRPLRPVSREAWMGEGRRRWR